MGTGYSVLVTRYWVFVYRFWVLGCGQITRYTLYGKTLYAKFKTTKAYQTSF